ncbi:MAG: outer membrane beta-barrel protein [Oligoflexales bacterium]
MTDRFSFNLSYIRALACATFALFVPTHAFSIITLGLSGTAETTNSDYLSKRDHAVSFRTGVSLGDHFQVGLAHRRSADEEVNTDKGYRVESESITNSADLTFIPFTGYVSPYVFGGQSLKTVKGKYYSVEQGTFDIPESTTTPVIYGFGIQVFLNANFSLRVSQTYSPSERKLKIDGVEDKKKTLDSYTEVGINYKLQ